MGAEFSYFSTEKLGHFYFSSANSIKFCYFYEKKSSKLPYEKMKKKKKKNCKGEICIQKLELLNKMLCTVKKYGKTKNATFHQ